MKKTIAAIAAGAVAMMVFGPPSNAAKSKKPVVVGKDAADDWGANTDPTIAPAGGPLGQELVEAAVGMADKDTLNFIIKTSMLPPNGGVPEFTRYLWTFSVDGEYRELDGKYTNYSRGACDPTSGQCPPPRDPGLYAFLVRGNCITDQVVQCEEIGVVHATFDPATSTITIPVPLEMLGAKPGSKIAPATSDAAFLGQVAAITSAYYSVANEPHDGITVTKTFKVPR